MKWCTSKASLVGKTAIITGANTGIGYETALNLAQRGARVILACRDNSRGEAARSKIAQETGSENVINKHLDLSSFASVRKFAAEINSEENRLDILVNNAGVGRMDNMKQRTEDGQIFVMQVNYLSHFLLTNLLLDLLKKSAPSRVINVASIAAKWASGLDPDKLEEFPGAITLGNNTKLCNMLFAIEFSERFKESGVTAYSLHPGGVKTEIFRGWPWYYKMFMDASSVFMRSPEEGAQTSIYLAVTKGIEEFSGEHFDDCQKVKRYGTAAKPGLAKRLWDVSEKLTKLN